AYLGQQLIRTLQFIGIQVSVCHNRTTLHVKRTKPLSGEADWLRTAALDPLGGEASNSVSGTSQQGHLGMDRLQICCHQVHVSLRHVQGGMTESLLKQEWRSPLTNVVDSE